MVIDNLEKRGLVHRDRNPEDRRMIVVSLTEAGSQHISSIFPFHVKSIVEEMGVLTVEEQETLGKLCRKLGKQGQK
jgi:MarR family 2-MHQ and catechol resistance regulon transcriptional repressor